MKSLIVIAVLATGCRSAPSHYYTLVPPAGATVESGGVQFEMMPVEVPADVDRTQIVVRQGAGQVSPVDNESWIAPLPLEMRRAFADVIAQAVGGRDVPDAPIRVKLVVQRFESTLDDRALIDATWTITNGDDTATCSARASEKPVKGKGYPGLVAAHQKALVTIANQIADGVKTMATTKQKPECARTASDSPAPPTSRS